MGTITVNGREYDGETLVGLALSVHRHPSDYAFVGDMLDGPWMTACGLHLYDKPVPLVAVPVRPPCRRCFPEATRCATH
jgi:hypothetical protein